MKDEGVQAVYFGVIYVGLDDHLFGAMAEVMELSVFLFDENAETADFGVVDDFLVDDFFWSVDKTSDLQVLLVEESIQAVDLRVVPDLYLASLDDNLFLLWTASQLGDQAC